jgi:hypothetical protein
MKETGSAKRGSVEEKPLEKLPLEDHERGRILLSNNLSTAKLILRIFLLGSYYNLSTQPSFAQNLTITGILYEYTRGYLPGS